MSRLIVFGGTTEGRRLTEFLRLHDVPCVVCVATEYGEAVIEGRGCAEVRRGRLDESRIRALICEERAPLVIDATHPYAEAVSANLKSACAAEGTEYLRVLRGSEDHYNGCEAFTAFPELVEWLSGTKGIVFVATGMKSASFFTRLPDFRERVYFRILPALESLSACLELGYRPDRLICMQGPFSRELNAAMFRETGAEILVTKNSGPSGGFYEKLSAARDCGMRAAVVTRPPDTSGVAFDEAEGYIARKFGIEV